MSEINPTGVHPVEFKLLIRVDIAKEVSDGGIVFSDVTREREQLAVDRGTVVEVSEMTFSGWKGDKPIVGDRVLFDKYKGTAFTKNIDGKRETYRLVNDANIIAILEEEDE